MPARRSILNKPSVEAANWGTDFSSVRVNSMSVYFGALLPCAFSCPV